MTDPMDKIAELDEELGLNDKRTISAVTLIDYMGTDMSVVNAARVSFDKRSHFYTLTDNAKLIKYLAKHKHWSPFAHTCLSFRIKAPIFVARQLAKHQVGLAWNEVSRRYVKNDPSIWFPMKFRKASPDIKQGSLQEPVQNERLHADYAYAVHLAVRTYETLLREGVCPEQARAILPQSLNTEWIWTGSLYAFFRVVSQRTGSDAQLETRGIAEGIAHHCGVKFPLSWEALTEAKNA